MIYTAQGRAPFASPSSTVAAVALPVAPAAAGHENSASRVTSSVLDSPPVSPRSPAVSPSSPPVNPPPVPRAPVASPSFSAPAPATSVPLAAATPVPSVPASPPIERAPLGTPSSTMVAVLPAAPAHPRLASASRVSTSVLNSPVAPPSESDAKVPEPTEVPAGGVGPCSDASSSGCTRTEEMCRYCYKRTEEGDSCTACLCKGLLCHTCLIREMQLTLNRREGVMKCTVCHHRFNISTEKMGPTENWVQRFKFALKQLVCCKRDNSVFEDQFFLVRPSIAWKFIAAILVWLVVTVTSEVVDRMRPFGDTRIISYMIDMILARQLFEVVEQFDIPERFFLALAHLSRACFLGAAVFFRVVEVHAASLDELMRMKGRDRFHTKSLHYVIAMTSLWYSAVSAVFVALEVARIQAEVRRRARRARMKDRRINIHSIQGQVFGPFSLQADRSFGASSPPGGVLGVLVNPALPDLRTPRGVPP